MIAFSYHRNVTFRRAGSMIVCMLLFVCVSQPGWAQQRAEQLRDVIDAPVQKTQLSEAALNRMTETVTAKREEKRQAGAAFKSADREQAAGIGRSLAFGAADISYSSAYWDTQAGDNFSFPEDTHDYCRAYFSSDAADGDYYLNATIDAGAALDVVLNWTGEADYDLYLFDVDGYPVGDADPEADFSGANGIAYQGTGDPSTETASIVHDRGAVSNEFVVVVDRFRGAAGTLDLTLSGDDGVFAVLEYLGDKNFEYIDAVTDVILGPLTDGVSINLASLGSPRPNFNAQFNSDGCAQSIVFTLVDASTGDVVQEFTDNDAPYALFGDEAGDYNAGDLADGDYILYATEFSGDDGQGASVGPDSVGFSIVSDQEPGVESFSLIDAVTSMPIDGFDPIAEGSVIDLVALFNAGFNIDSLNIAANVVDPAGVVEQVDLNMDIVLLSEAIQTLSTLDGAPPYSVYGDNNVDDFFGTLLPLGTYSLSGDALADGAVFTSANVNFTVIGPRVSSFTLIDALTEQPIDGSAGTPDYDPIPDGAVIDMNTLGTDSLNIRANTIDYTNPVIESVRLMYVVAGDGGATIVNTVESFRPYAVFGDPTNKDLADDDPVLNYNSWAGVINEGFVLSGQPYGENGGTGELYGPMTINFSITNAVAFSDSGLKDELALLPNYPNPFNPTTSIRFNLPGDSPVKLQVFDMLGRVVVTLVDGNLKSGYHEINFEGRDLSSGMYMYRLETPTGVQVRPMTLLK